MERASLSCHRHRLCIVELLPSIKVCTFTTSSIALFPPATSLRCFILFLGRLRLCVLFTELTFLLIRLICHHVTTAIVWSPVVGFSTVANLPPPCHLPSIGYAHFSISPPSPPFLSFSVLSRTSGFRFLKSSKAAPLDFFYFLFFWGSRELALPRGEIEGVVSSALLVRNNCGTGLNIETQSRCEGL